MSTDAPMGFTVTTDVVCSCVKLLNLLIKYKNPILEPISETGCEGDQVTTYISP